MHKALNIGDQILLTLWVGGMWSIGYIVAPVLFSVIDDRQQAGLIAGHIFTAMSIIGLICGVSLLLSNLFQHPIAKNWRAAVLVLMLVLISISQFVIQPIMADLKAQGLVQGSEQAIQFGRMHGVSSVLFLITSIAGLILVISPRK